MLAGCADENLSTLKLRRQPGGLARATFSTGAGLGTRALVQAAIFVIVSRTLGVQSYGIFAAVFGLATVFGSLAALGSQVVLLRDVSRQRNVFPAAWGRTLLAISVSSPVLFAAYLLLANSLLPDQVLFATIALVGIAEIIMTPLALSAVTAYQAHDRMGRAARLTLFPALPRFVSAIVLWILAPGLQADSLLLIWAVLYALSAVAAAIYAQGLAYRDLGPAQRVTAASVWATVRQGFPFVAGSAAVRIHNEIDKPMLFRLSTLEQTGVYSAGYRVIDLVIIPISSVLTASWPRFFREGSRGSKDILTTARSLLAYPAIYALGAGSLLYIGAGLLPLILGRDYTMASEVLRWLAWLPLAALPRLLLQQVLTSSNRQFEALFALILGAATNFLLNLWLIPGLGWKGAVLATYLAELLMIVSMATRLRATK